MDTSKEYIKMCFEAKELQDRDFFYFMSHPKEYVAEYQSKLGGIMTWLPRQDQLQEMIGKHYLRELIKIFIYWWDNNWQEHPEFASMEQLWLAFVMKEKYNKIWDGEKWAPCEK